MKSYLKFTRSSDLLMSKRGHNQQNTKKSKTRRDDCSRHQTHIPMRLDQSGRISHVFIHTNDSFSINENQHQSVG